MSWLSRCVFSALATALVAFPLGAALAAGDEGWRIKSRIEDGVVAELDNGLVAVLKERRTALYWLDPYAGTLTPALVLPSGGDTSYPGFVWWGDLLWVSYYSSHEGKASIYLARVRVLPTPRDSAKGEASATGTWRTGK